MTIPNLAASLTAAQRKAVLEGRVSECYVNHPAGTRCPNCSAWPFKKGGAAEFVSTMRAYLKDQPHDQS